MLAIVRAGLVRSPQNKSVHYRQPHRHMTVKVYVCTNLFKMSSVCSNASSKTWTPLPDRLIDEPLVEMFLLFHQARLQLVNVMIPNAIHTLLQLPPNLVDCLHCTISPASAL